eukprot:221270-Chlamydomonas_euryale.AAC.1
METAPQLAQNAGAAPFAPLGGRNRQCKRRGGGGKGEDGTRRSDVKPGPSCAADSQWLGIALHKAPENVPPRRQHSQHPSLHSTHTAHCTHMCAIRGDLTEKCTMN